MFDAKIHITFLLFILLYSFFLYIKLSSGYYQNKQRKALKKAYERYEDLTKEEKNKKCKYTHEQYRNLSKEEKNKNCQYGCKRYKTLYEDEKQ